MSRYPWRGSAGEGHASGKPDLVQQMVLVGIHPKSPIGRRGNGKNKARVPLSVS